MMVANSNNIGATGLLHNQQHQQQQQEHYYEPIQEEEEKESSHCHGNHQQQQELQRRQRHDENVESSPLLPSSPTMDAAISSFSLFNDLTYSDDDDSDDSDMNDIESPTAFLDGVQNSILSSPPHGGHSYQQQQAMLLQPPMHPLARLDSETDEGSYLAYSISSFPGEEEGSHQGSSNTAGNHHCNQSMPPASSYGSMGSLASSAAVIFRQTSPVFGQSSLSKQSYSSKHHHHHHQHQQQQSQHYQHQQPPQQQQPQPQPQQYTSKSPSSNYYQVFPSKNSYPATPIPSLTHDSPATSATATDTTLSPSSPPTASSPPSPAHGTGYNDGIYLNANYGRRSKHGNNNRNSNNKSSPKKTTNSTQERIAKQLNEEAARKLRKHKRLKRIKKAAEAREAAVQKVRGVDQFPCLEDEGSDGGDDINAQARGIDGGDGVHVPNGVGNVNDNYSQGGNDDTPSCCHCLTGKTREKKPAHKQYNDAIFAIIFLAQLFLVSIAAITFGPGALRDKIYGALNGNGSEYGVGGIGGGGVGSNAKGVGEDYNPFAGLQSDDVIIAAMYRPANSGGEEFDNHDDDQDWNGISHIDYINVIQLVCIASGYASISSLLALGFMMMLSKSLLHATLLLTIIVSLAWTCLGLAFSSYTILPTTGIVALAFSIFYTVVVWERIPFAATNLSVALKGMRSTLDIPMVGIGILGVSFLWTIWWICAFIGVFDFLNDDVELSDNWMGVVVAFFLFSYYWTIQVIKGISQATVAAIIGKWWSIPEDSLPICSGALRLSLYRNLSSSFGSICLGGLVIGPCILMCRISTLIRLAQPTIKPPTKNATTSENKSCSSGGCSERISCTAAYSDNVISRNVNQWSFTHIGLYGYKFWDSGGKASQLFEARGWTHVVSDDLILTAISMSSMVIGGSTACLGLIVEEVDGYSFTSLHKPITTAFLIGLFTGFYLSSAFLSIIEGSVSAILVNYATAPVEFHANHHVLSEEMKSVWKEFWLS